MVKHTLKKSCGVHTARFLNYVWPLWKRKTCKHLRNFDQISQNLGHTYVNIEVFQQKQRVKRKLLQHWYNVQKQPFADALQNRCSKKFHKTDRKTPVLESLFDKAADLKIFYCIKKETPTQVFSCKYYEIFMNRFFYKNVILIAYTYRTSTDYSADV